MFETAKTASESIRILWSKRKDLMRLKNDMEECEDCIDVACDFHQARYEELLEDYE